MSRIVKVKTGQWRPGFGKTIPAIYQPRNRDVIPLDFDSWDYFLRTIQIYGRFGPQECWPDESQYHVWLARRMSWIYNSRTMLTKGTSLITKKIGGVKVITKKIKWIGNYYASGLAGVNVVEVMAISGKWASIKTFDSDWHAPNPFQINPLAAGYECRFGRTNAVNWKNQPILVSESEDSIWDGAIAPLISRTGDMLAQVSTLEL